MRLSPNMKQFNSSWTIKWKRGLTVIFLSGIGMMTGLNAQSSGETPTPEQMWAMIQQQQAEIQRLTALVEESRSGAETAVREAEVAKSEAAEARAESLATQAQVEATALAIEDMASDSGSGATGWWERTSVGGYGELHANFYDNGDDAIDFHRFVLFVNHKYNDWITLYSELEVEHSYAGEGKPGAVELEQAFIRMDWSETFSTDAGLFLMPIGMINDIHEPNTFYGVERNNVEVRIIPTTWWEAGLRGNWRFENGLSVEAGITSGLDVNENGVIRSGRQKVAKAVNNVPAYHTRVKYTGVPGLELGFSAFYQDDMAQSVSADIQGLLTSGHIDYRTGNFRIKALYARWDLDGTADADAESQYGWFIEPSYRWNIDEDLGDIGVYFRYSDYEYFASQLLDNQIFEIGLNWWPTNNVVFKADLQDISESDQYGSKGDFVYNLGVGYQF